MFKNISAFQADMRIVIARHKYKDYFLNFQ